VSNDRPRCPLIQRADRESAAGPPAAASGRRVGARKQVSRIEPTGGGGGGDIDFGSAAVGQRFLKFAAATSPREFAELIGKIRIGKAVPERQVALVEIDGKY